MVNIYIHLVADNLIYITRGQITSYRTHQQAHDTKQFKVITDNTIVNDIGVQTM